MSNAPDVFPEDGSVDERRRHSGLNRFNKSTFKEISDANGERYSRLSKVAKPASYCRRARNDVSVSVSMEPSHRVRSDVDCDSTEEDDFANSL